MLIVALAALVAQPDNMNVKMRYLLSIGRPLRLALLIFVATTAVFWEVPQLDFVAWDDNNLVYNNPHLDPATADSIEYFWRHPYLQLYMPLTYSTWGVLANASRLPAPREVSGVGYIDLQPRLFHVANLVLHLLNVCLVFAILRLLARNDWAAAAGALLFGIHPLQVESVAWISELKGVLCGFFSLLALWHYLKCAVGEQHETLAKASTSRRIRYVAALSCFLLALLCKPIAVTIPFIAWALDRWLLQRPSHCSLRALMPWMVVSLGWSVFTRAAQPYGDFVVQPLWWRPLVAGDALAFYLGKLMWPLQLGIDYGRTPAWVVSQPSTYIIWLVPATLAVLIWRGRKQRPWLLAAGLVTLATLLPVLGLIPFNFQQYSTVADRYLYLGMLGPALALAYFLACVGQRQKVVVGLCLVMLFGLGIRSAFQTLTWSNSLVLYQNAVAVNPRSWVAHRNYADALDEQGRSEEAIAHLNEVLQLRPGYALTHTSLARIFARQGHLKLASAHLYEALRLEPEDKVKTEAHNNIGAILLMQGKTTEAMKHFRDTLKHQPDNMVAHYNLGIILLSRGEVKASLPHLREAVRLDPYSEAAQNALAQAQQRMR